jgi:hypothetical protein
MEHVAGIVVSQPQRALGAGGAAVAVAQGLQSLPEAGAEPDPVQELLDVGHPAGKGGGPGTAPFRLRSARISP